METCISVPIKTINTRLPGKTFREINGKPLYSYLFTTLQNMLRAKEIGNVNIYSSDDRVLTMAKEWGFFPAYQPAEYDTNPVVTGDFLIEKMIPYINRFDVMGWLHITSPFLTRETIKKSISYMNDNLEVDSLFGVVPRHNRFWYQDKPVNHDIKKLVRTQDLTPLHEEADFYFFRKEAFDYYKKRVCGNFKTIEVSRIEAVDIDTLEDLIYAESLVKAGLVGK